MYICGLECPSFRPNGEAGANIVQIYHKMLSIDFTDHSAHCNNTSNLKMCDLNAYIIHFRYYSIFSANFQLGINKNAKL